jgi:hypothetical protein
MALGELGSLAEGREVIGKSFDLQRFEPRTRDASAWDEVYARYLQMRRE